jgi:carboxyl-terminal processing protease
MDKKRNIGYIILPLILAGGIICGIFIGKYAAQEKISSGEEKLRTVLGLIQSQYVDEIDVDSLLDATIPDLLASLDPHSVYIPASELEATNDDLDSSFGGIGVSFQILNDTVHVIEVINGGPAEKAGVLPGDKVIEADGKSLTGADVTNESVFAALRGHEGTKVKIVVSRKSSKKPLTFDLVRGEIPSNSVDAKYMVDKEIGYIKVSKFARNTYNEFFTALASLQKSGAQKFVIDLRGNAGGFMDQAIYMANEFLPEGKTIVYTKGRTPENETIAVSDGTGHYQSAEIVVLTNEYSASASEIFSGAIQDNDRGLIIGRRTFGKGLVQNQIALPDSSSIRLTVARYYTPSGRSIQKEYKRGKDGKYQMDLVDRYAHGEFYSEDSIKLDKSKLFHTVAGRKVYGGGGIMPDVFVPEDTTGYTGYYIEAMNRGIIQNYAHDLAEQYRTVVGKNKSLPSLLRILPRDNTLLTSFVGYAATKGLPSRWYYINLSRDLLLNQIKAVIARDLIGFDAYVKVLNDADPTVIRAVEDLKAGKSSVSLKPTKNG